MGLGLKGQQTIRELSLPYMMGYDCQERLALALGASKLALASFGYTWLAKALLGG